MQAAFWISFRLFPTLPPALPTAAAAGRAEPLPSFGFRAVQSREGKAAAPLIKASQQPACWMCWDHNRAGSGAAPAAAHSLTPLESPGWQLRNGAAELEAALLAAGCRLQSSHPDRAGAWELCEQHLKAQGKRQTNFSLRENWTLRGN